MATGKTAKYKRVLLKVSGEALSCEDGKGISPEKLAKVAKEVKSLVKMGVQVGIVVGGGNFWRGRTSGDMDRALADQIGMLATCMNGLALKDALSTAKIETRLLTAVSMPSVAEPYTINRARTLLDKGVVVVFAGGTGSPFFSTDTGAALRAVEIQADVILLAKKVDAVYDSDPEINPNAKRFDKITHTEVLEKDLKVMDSTAASLCRDNGMKIHVFGLAEKNAIVRACKGEKIGTVVY
ncbi:MAG: UMP kinase [Clostridia bacterium]|nr:UMP kinase [Clostridia bacterium]